MSRRPRLLALTVALATVIGGLSFAATPAVGSPSGIGPFCSDNSGVTPCILSATVQAGSAAPEEINAASTDYGVGIDPCTPVAKDGSCEGGIGWSTYLFSGTVDPSPTWTISFDLGQIVPTETDTWGVNTTTTRVARRPGRGRSGVDYRVTITGQPTLIDDGSSCTQQGAAVFLCGERASSTSYSYFGFVSDYYYNEPAAQAAASYGMDTWTTSSATGAPLFLGSTPDGVITIPIGNTHLHADGSVVHGAYHAFLPDALLVYMGIDDPSTITSGSLAVTLASGTVAITPAATGVSIDLTDIIWPEPGSGGNAAHARGVAGAKKAKNLPIKIRPGVITPTRPTKVRAHRTSSTRAHLTALGARARGSKIVRYQASCSAKHEPTRTGTAKSKKHLVVTGLADRTYSCKARAVAKAGHGHWSKSVTLHR